MINYRNKLVEGLKIIKVNVSKEQIDMLLNFMERVLEKNKVLNLTAIRDREDFITKHLIDSLTVEKFLPQNSKVIDIGTGAGFPGIPLKIVRPDLHITLLDSRGKKIKFVNEIIEEFGLKNTYAIAGRAEDLGNSEKRATFDIAILRAVSSLSVLAEYSLPLIKKQGILIAMRGSEGNEEKLGLKSLNILGGVLSKVDNLTLPFSEIKRKIIIVQKIKDTPKGYPRRAGIPAKNPL